MNQLKCKSVTIFSDKGGREYQEDQVLVDQDRGIFVLADGFGGPMAGLGAAKCAVESVTEFLKREAGDEEATLPFEIRSYYSLSGNILFNGLLYANRGIIKQNNEKQILEKGGASVIAAYFNRDLLALASIGNCSSWLLRNGEISELTLARSYARCIALDDISDLARTPIMSLGTAEDMQPEICEYRLYEGDWILLSTIGVRRSMVEHLILQQSGSIPPTEAGQGLLDLCQTTSFDDNVSLVFVCF